MNITENALVALFVQPKITGNPFYGSSEVANRARELYKISKVETNGNVLDVTLDCIKCHESKIPKPLRLKIEVVK